MTDPTPFSRPSIWSLAITGGVPRRSFIVAVIVGIVLNAVNQGDALVAGGPLDYLKLGLTFVVPYCVATYGAVGARLQALRATDAKDERGGPLRGR